MEENHFQHPVLGRQWQTDQPNVAKEISRISIFCKTGRERYLNIKRKSFSLLSVKKCFRSNLPKTSVVRLGDFLK